MQKAKHLAHNCFNTFLRFVAVIILLAVECSQLKPFVLCIGLGIGAPALHKPKKSGQTGSYRILIYLLPTEGSDYLWSAFYYPEKTCQDDDPVHILSDEVGGPGG